MSNDRVQFEGDAVLGEALAERMAESAWPGVFSGGKQIVATEAGELPVGDEGAIKGKYIKFTFNDGSQMSIVGTDFEIRYKQPVLERIPRAKDGLLP